MRREAGLELIEIAMIRKNHLFAGSDSSGIRAAAMYTPIESPRRAS
jgi:hypothetical protein